MTTDLSWGSSAETMAAVEAAGFGDAKHVQGGVAAWARQVDLTLPITDGPFRMGPEAGHL